MNRASLLLSLLVVASIVEFAAAQVNVHFANPSQEPAQVEWVNENGTTYYMTVPAGETRSLQSYVGHRWRMSNSHAVTATTVRQAEQVISLAGYQSGRPQVDNSRPSPGPFDNRGTATASLNQSVVNYARSVVGQRIGNGQCTELATAALRAAGAQPGQNYVWGTTLRGVEDLQPGDIIQMFDASFEMPDGSSSWSTGPHTAIVTGVRGSVIEVLHQNVAGSPVQAGEYDLRYLTAGRLSYYRPAAGNGGGQFGNQFGGQFGSTNDPFSGNQFPGNQFPGNTGRPPRSFQGNTWQQGLQPIPHRNSQNLGRLLNLLFE